MKKGVNDAISNMFNKEFKSAEFENEFLLFSIEIDSEGFPKSILKKSSASFNTRMCILSLLEEQVKQERKEMMEQLERLSNITKKFDELISKAPESIQGILKQIAQDVSQAKLENDDINSEIDNILKDLKQKFGYEGNDATGNQVND